LIDVFTLALEEQMSKKVTLIIAAVAMILVAASSAYAYTELWTGGCGSGTLTYNGDDYYYGYGNYTGYIRDTTKTAGQRDTFDLYTNTWHAVFYYDLHGANPDSLVILNYSWGFRGGKVTGTSGTKYGSGTFYAACSNKVFLFTSTWSAMSSPYGFFYTSSPPTVSGTWSVDANQPYYGPGTLTGSGTFSLTRAYYTP